MLRTIFFLPAVLLFLLPAIPASTQELNIKLPEQLKPCDCLECLKQYKLSAKATRKAYEDRLPKAIEAIQKEIAYFNSHPEYAEGKILFCQMWSTYEDEVNLVRDIMIPDIHKDIFGDDKKCGTLAGGTTDPATCEVDPYKALVNLASAPCEQIHLAILAHELVHAEDCEWNQNKPDWMAEGKTCKEAFAGKPTPTIEQFLAYVKFTFNTEEHAHRVESQVEDLLANELARECKTGDYSSQMASNRPEASKFLKRAREFEFKFPEEAAVQ
jgi:hypothetical protein